jgi:hypothetical protein
VSTAGYRLGTWSLHRQEPISLKDRRNRAGAPRSETAIGGRVASDPPFFGVGPERPARQRAGEHAIVHCHLRGVTKALAGSFQPVRRLVESALDDATARRARCRSIPLRRECPGALALPTALRWPSYRVDRQPSRTALTMPSRSMGEQGLTRHVVQPARRASACALNTFPLSTMR